MHKTDAAIDALIFATQGEYAFSPRYSPDMKPIERGFSNVKRLLRANEQWALDNPVLFLNRTFHTYSLFGPLGHRGTPTYLKENELIYMRRVFSYVAKSHFQLYEKEHKAFLFG